MSLKIIKAGVADTIQDNGRYGWQYLGINPCGCMDKYAACLANALVCNDPGEAVIEMHFPAPVFLFQQPALAAITGADFSASVNGEPLPLYQPVFINKNAVLQFHEPARGVRSYMAVQGGFDIPDWLNSYSTHLKAKAGGYQGRALQKDDEIPFKQLPQLPDDIINREKFIFPWRTDPGWGDPGANEIFVLPGNEWEWLTEESQQQFEKNEFIITPHADRMGYRLSGIMLNSRIKEELVSSAVNFGTVQLLPDGRMILLMADHQTTGGYPRIAHVISAHHSKLAQMKPGDNIRFLMTDQQTTENLLWKQQQHLKMLKNACQYKLNAANTYN
jgi:antagonist of KipI